MKDEHLIANRLNWDDRVPNHLASQLYDIEGFLAGRRRLRPEEVELLGDLTGVDVVHLQCHVGTDTLTLARAGATVTGLDLSPASIAAAQDLAERSGLADRSTFVEADVHRAVEVLGPERFDLVYVSIGALCWLPSVEEWAGQVAGLLRPGGRLYLQDTHPMSWSLGDELRIEWPWFERSAPFEAESEHTYTDGDARLEHPRSFQWNHSIGELISAVLSAGLVVDAFREESSVEFARFPWLVSDGDGRWRFPDDVPEVPLTMTLLAHRPA